MAALEDMPVIVDVVDERIRYVEVLSEERREASAVTRGIRRMTPSTPTTCAASGCA
jgi:hypothetical protein